MVYVSKTTILSPIRNIWDSVLGSSVEKVVKRGDSLGTDCLGSYLKPAVYQPYSLGIIICLPLL
jgi:hypothetical protein